MWRSCALSNFGEEDVGGGVVRFRKDIERRLSSCERSERICFGILHVQGTIPDTKTTIKGVNSPHTRNSSPNNGTFLISCQLRNKSWKSERERALSFIARGREP